MTIDFDPARSWTALEERLARTDSPRHRQLLQVVIDHVKGEVARDIDALMGTLVAEPNYHFWVDGKDVGPKGAAGVRTYYEWFVRDGGAVLESIKDRIVVDDDIVSHEGPVRNIVSGTIAKRRGYSVPSEEGHYLVRFRNCVWWSFDEAGLALGEDSYTTIDPDDWERLGDSDLPAAYVAYLDELKADNVVT